MFLKKTNKKITIYNNIDRNIDIIIYKKKGEMTNAKL